MPYRMYADSETFCETDLPKHGSYRYSEKAEIMLFTYAFDNRPVKLWDRTIDPAIPADLEEGLNDPDLQVVFHNGGGFDRLIIKECLGIEIKPDRIHDTMARAQSHGLPGGLDFLCDIFNPPVSKAKDKTGKKLIQLFCKPRPARSKIRRATRKTHPLEWAKFCVYAQLDIEAMRWMDGVIPLWNYRDYEFGLWCRDQRINSRGCHIDRELCEAALRAVDRAQGKLAERTSEITFGDVASATQRDELLRHILEAYGVSLPDMQASTLERRINDPDLPMELKELLMIRIQSTAISTSKYQKFLKMVNADGRYRGALQFSGAARTKRWAARGVQLQNLPRPTMKAEEIEFGIECMKADCEDLFFEDVMDLARNAVRGCIISAPGKKLYISDLANIEGRDAAWIAGEAWKLQAFREYDTFLLDRAGNKIPDGKGGFKRLGPDLYIKSYANAFRVAIDSVTKMQRQIGKVMELMLQYAGGVGAFVTGALTYGIDLEELARIAWPLLPPDVQKECEGMWEWAIKKKRTLGLPQHIFMACDGLKRLWRRAHPEIVTGWKEIEEAARNAIDSKNTVYTVRRLAFERKGNWLRMILPSGYFLCYPSPKINNSGEISFMGINQYSRQWNRLKTYGGKLFENACQATARDVMAWNMERIEDAGYDIVLSIHDELITEAPDNKNFSHEHLSKLLATNPAWADELPLAAGGFESHRYRKES